MIQLFNLYIPGYIFPVRVNDRYNGQLAHRMVLHTQEATIHVYAHQWGPKAICHDALEQVMP